MPGQYSVFPSIIPDDEGDFVDNTYNKAELERKDYQELKSIAAEHESESVHGQMTQEDMIEGLTGLQRL